MFTGSLEDIRKTFYVNGEPCVYTGSFSRVHVFRKESGSLIPVIYEEQDNYQISSEPTKKASAQVSSLPE